jgi:hypothetical protein
MIAGLSKAVTLYLAPLLFLAAIFLSLFAYLAPTILLHDQVALLAVVPSASLTQPNSSQNVDGPSVFLGILGSCSRPHNGVPVNCTAPTVSPIYELSVLPNSGANLSLSAPTQGTPIFVAMGLTLSIFFFVVFVLISFRHKMSPKLTAILDKPLVQRLAAWTGFFGFFIGITSFLVLRMWFGKAVTDFNATIQAQGAQGAQLVAGVGNAFTMVWVAYAFYAVPVIISLAKLNVTASK